MPLKLTTELLMNPVPLTVSVKAAAPATPLVGAIVVIAGAGLLAWETVKLTAFEIPPPGCGLVTVTGNEPVLATAEAGIAAVI